MDCDLRSTKIGRGVDGGVVTLVHFYCGLRLLDLYLRLLSKSCSNPCPFLLWIATLAIRNKRKEKTRSNPCPFLLWIATAFTGSFTLAVISCSNPCPFLLWIATVKLGIILVFHDGVVTLVHFYCGLRLTTRFRRSIC